jgi:hypothetical protein
MEIQVEWSQPLSGGTPPRIFPVVQPRVCFTELSPPELPEHGITFGQFALEFEIDTLRGLGGVPVFYVPQPSSTGSDGSAVGTALVAITMDATAVISRAALLHGLLNGPVPAAEHFSFNVGLARSPGNRGEFVIDRDEAKNVVAALGHGVTPWPQLDAGIYALLNLFYPADNVKHGKPLEYYRQREWRIACNFAIKGTEVLREPTESEKGRITKIDSDFFLRDIQTDLGPVATLSRTLVHPGLNGKRIIQMVRRIILPAAAIKRVSEILEEVDGAPEVVPTDVLRDP